ncbi:hemerythrin domain-containing protein [Solihabitans fulvus]|uniref:Hemerythrin domain-containing protein n=1 Tax=Solihabitans fulvus TaxID=1892852 RepID=A0A5B2XJ48_9PSEU|nr:hemerythrin domain-containing protein [Solihabitans fulvus]KAA2263254.1 hemerythrin domain-containing protein [Solihabitans fulvus]
MASPTEPTEPGDRARAFGNQLIDVHNWLRDELDRLREDVERHLDGEVWRPRDLRANCLTFCSALTRHHTGEDRGAFPLLGKEFPELRPVLAELERDHHLVNEVLRGLADLLGGLGGSRDTAEARRVRTELDTLAALLETHLTYEEKRIVAALDSLSVPAWRRDTPDFLRSTGNPEV